MKKLGARLLLMSCCGISILLDLVGGKAHPDILCPSDGAPNSVQRISEWALPTRGGSFGLRFLDWINFAMRYVIS